MKLNDLDRDILFLTFKFYGLQVTQMSVILGIEEQKISRRVRELRTRGFVDNALVLGNNEKALVYIKKKGMRALGELSEFDWIDDIDRREWTKSQMLAEHVRGEAEIAAWLALPGNQRTGFSGQIPVCIFQSERDVRAAAYEKGHKIPKYLDKGIHMPDGLIRMNTGYICIEFERTVKPKSADTQMIDNMRSNADRFKAQLWFVNSRTARIVEAAAKEHPEWGIIVVLMDTVKADLARYNGENNLIWQSDKNGQLVVRGVNSVPLRELPLRNSGSSVNAANYDDSGLNMTR